MGSVVTRAWQGEQVQRTSILMLGLDFSGKTSILFKLKIGDIETQRPVIGFSVEVAENHNTGMKLTSWDVGGSEVIRPVWSHYLNDITHFIFVVDSADDGSRLEVARDVLHKLLKDEKLQTQPLLIFANKQDLPNAVPVHELQEKLELQSQDMIRPWKIEPCCAISGEGLSEGLSWLASASSFPQRFHSTKSARS
jgi:small GTP-binding protein